MAAQTGIGNISPRQKAQVRSIPDDTNLTIALLLGDRQRNMNRPKDEPLEKVIARMRATVAPAGKKGGKKRTSEGPSEAPQEAPPASPVEIQLFEDYEAGREVAGSTLNEEAWRLAKVLRVGSTLFDIDYNPPTVEKAVIPRRPMVGFPIMPRLRVLFASDEETRFSWSRKKPGTEQWQDLHCNSRIYTPQPEDVGYQLQLKCMPAAAAGRSTSNGAEAGAARLGDPLLALSDIVEAAPARTAAQMRCSRTSDRRANRPAFRILSYNLLADQYAGSTYAQQVLFDYCPPEALDFDYRCQLVLQELLGYQGDVLCLQEVDEKMFTEHLMPHLTLHGYDGHFTNKQGKVREGSATFWHTSRFQRLHTQDIMLRDVFKQPLAPAHAQWQRMLDASPHLATALQMVTTIAQATILQPVDESGRPPHPAERPLCVVNTHLFYHPYAPHIRAMHTAAILEEAHAMLKSWVSDNGGDGQQQQQQQQQQQRRQRQRHPSLIFCGDLNSDLNDGIPGVIELLQNGFLPADHWDWYVGAEFRWGMGEEVGSTEQQAAAPQPPNSAIAATVAAAKEAAAARSSPKSGKASQDVPQQSSTEDMSHRGEAPGPSGDTQGGGTQMSSRAWLQLPADDRHAFDTCRVPKAAIGAPAGIDVRIPYALRSADDLRTPFTNYTSGYKALLDYVWIEQDALEVLDKVPIPSEDEMGSFIPSSTFPSDHLAVVYDLRWKDIS